MRNRKFYLVPNDSYKQFYFAVKGLKCDRIIIRRKDCKISEQDGRLKSSDLILQINDINVQGKTSEQVAAVLRQCGQEVRLIVSRGVDSNPGPTTPFSPVILTSQMNEELARLNDLLENSPGFICPPIQSLNRSKMDPNLTVNQLVRFSIQ